jgi:hypothetical protein
MAFKLTALDCIASADTEDRDELVQEYSTLLDSFYAAMVHVTDACRAITCRVVDDATVPNEIARAAVIAWFSARAHLRQLDPATAASPEHIACARIALLEAREQLSSALTIVIAQKPEPAVRVLLEYLLLRRSGDSTYHARASTWLA